MVNFKDKPLFEITLRKYENINFVNNIQKRDLLRKLCLSIGLINSRDKNDIIVDVLFVLMNAAKQKRMLRFDEIKTRVINLRKKFKLTELGCSDTNIHKVLRKLKEIQIIEVINGFYRIVEFLPLSYLFEERIFNFLILPTINNIKDYFKKTDELFFKNENK